jgi:hypothetical protein
MVDEYEAEAALTINQHAGANNVIDENSTENESRINNSTTPETNNSAHPKATSRVDDDPFDDYEANSSSLLSFPESSESDIDSKCPVSSLQLVYLYIFKQFRQLTLFQTLLPMMEIYLPMLLSISTPSLNRLMFRNLKCLSPLQIQINWRPLKTVQIQTNRL